MAEALADADAKAKAEQAERDAKAKALVAKADDDEDDPKALPWKIADLQDAMKIGTKLTYAMSGTNAKGKPIDDTYLVEIKGVSDSKGVSFVAYRQSEEKNPAVKQVQARSWDSYSPFFPVERPESEVAGRESVEVPAGSFETTKAELKGFFGEHYTVWMIVETPGVYAKLVEYGRGDDEKTEIVYELASLDVAE